MKKTLGPTLKLEGITLGSAGYYDYYAYLYAMEARIKELESRLSAAEMESQQLKASFSQIKPVHIEHIHYKVQELNIKELSGTLQLGLTAFTDSEQIDKWLKEQDSGQNQGLHIEGSEIPGAMEDS